MPKKMSSKIIEKAYDKYCDNIDCAKETKKTDERSWISLGNRMFHIEDVQSMYIQANHLIINFDYTDKQIVIHFGYGKKGEELAKIVFESLREMYGAYKVNIPEDANLYPDILKTAYGEHINREIQAQVEWKKKELKQRYKNKFMKLTKEMDDLKRKIESAGK